jgi:hypothetical protein
MGKEHEGGGGMSGHEVPSVAVTSVDARTACMCW